MTVAAFFGVMVLAVLGYLLSAAFGWLSLDVSGLSGFKKQIGTLPGLESLPIGRRRHRIPGGHDLQLGGRRLRHDR
jgi:hypothetical protein